MPISISIPRASESFATMMLLITLMFPLTRIICIAGLSLQDAGGTKLAHLISSVLILPLSLPRL
ncbi:MAG: hypothetical protein DRI77_05475 [Chloroflexi bacterium]|nr:MAG: hypothetical protein DRI77_05475 [Chloroflexota bacterium]